MYNTKLILTSIISLIIDIITKLLISNFLIENQSITIIPNVISLTYVKNTGIAFSFLESKIPFIIIITVIIILVLLKYLYNKSLSLLENISYGLILGGALGNLIDRIIYGYVIDFIDINIFNYPIFNLADTFIVIGIIIILILSFREGSSEKNEVSCRRKNEN